MKHLDNFNSFINENESASGEYTTDEMDAFVHEVIDLMQWSDDSLPTYKQNVLYTPSDRNSSVASYDGEEATENWANSIRRYKKDAGLKWFVWNLDAGGQFSKVKPISTQRYDIDEVLKLARKHPDSIRKIWISMISNDQADFTKAMRSENMGD